MSEYLSPGVYVEEVSAGPKSIEGVSTSTAGFLGETERGPTEAKFISNPKEFQRMYGEQAWKPAAGISYLPYAIEGFFTNGGKRCFIARITGAGSTSAGVTLKGGAEDTPHWTAPSSSDEESEETKPDKKSKKTSPPVDKSVSAGSGGLTIHAIGPGDWGNRISITIEDASEVSEKRPHLFKFIVAYQSLGPITKTVREEYDNLDINPSSLDFYEKKINRGSCLIKVEKSDEPVRPPNCKTQSLKGGSDGTTPKLNDYEGIEGIEGPTGLKAFEAIDEISIVCAPNENNITGLTDAMITHCEILKDRFAVLQMADGLYEVAKINRPADSSYAAFYYPWVRIVDPVTGGLKLVPPGGHIAGIYAQTDVKRGVHKAPANEVVRNVAGLEYQVTKAQQDMLNPKGINCIRNFGDRGIRVWGARTASSDPEWKYINVRRLFLYLEESIDEGCQWVVFEPNDERLWARVRQTITNFLTRVWRDGALMGRSAEEAFFVRCDRSTMMQDDIDNGRLIVQIGVAPVKPAEFVIFRIQQNTLQSGK